MKKLYFSLLFIATTLTVFSQEESEACQPPSKKIQKLITKAQGSSNIQEATTNFNAAIDADDKNAMAYYEFAMFAYNAALDAYDTNPNPATGDRLFVKAEQMFQLTLDVCPDYHSNCMYYLGVINYSQQEMDEAIKWFKAYKAFDHSDASKYSDDHSKRLKDISEVIGDLEYEDKIKNEEVPFDPVIVANVSTLDLNEYFPMISPDNELMFFTRKNKLGGPGFVTEWREQFTMASRANMKDKFNMGDVLTPPFNMGDVASYGASTLSVDNKEMIICACKVENVYGQDYKNCDLYSTTYELGGHDGKQYIWSELQNLGDAINTKDGWEGQPSLSADGKTLFFTANRGSTRDNDIFISKRKADGTWSQARPFDEINTSGKDKSPFLHQDSETLYFVSQVSKDRPGVGGLDIFYIRQQPDGSWTDPVNIGYPINSEDDELGLFVSIDGQVAFFSSRKGATWDIYSFELYEEARPQSVALLKGELKDEQGDPVEGATIEIAYDGSDEITQVKVNGNDGKYAAIVKTSKNQDVMVTVKKEGHAFDSKLIEKEEFKKEEVTMRGNDLEVRELKVGEAYTINDILYATNSSDLTNKSKFILKGFARFLKENPSINVSIQGHTDDVGNDDKNMKLSEDRAEGVMKYLISLGIDKKRLASKGFGETAPKVENDSEENRALNRRTDFVITGM